MSFSSATVTIPFDPVGIYVNEAEKLNKAMMANNLVLHGPINRYLGWADMQITASSAPDSAFVRVEHYWVAPDPIENNPFNATISSTHYWEIDGIIPESVEATGNLRYNGSNIPFLDEDLVGVTEDSLILVYREDASHPWVEHPDYFILNINPIDGAGNVIFTGLKKGQYAFANGDLPAVSVKNIFDEYDIKLFPNPTSSQLYIEGDLSGFDKMKYRVFDISGKLILFDELNNLHQQIDVSNLENGIYVFQILDDNGKSIGIEQFEVIR